MPAIVSVDTDRIWRKKYDRGQADSAADALDVIVNAGLGGRSAGGREVANVVNSLVYSGCDAFDGIILVLSDETLSRVGIGTSLAHA